MIDHVAEREETVNDAKKMAHVEASNCSDRRYITRRVIDACLREDVRNISSKSCIVPTEAIEQYLSDWRYIRADNWLSITHLGDFNIYIPIEKSFFFQPWKVVEPVWLKVQHDQVSSENHYREWLHNISCALSEYQQSYYHTYIAECDCAVAHRQSARTIYYEQKELLSQPLFRGGTGWAQMSASEQLAAHLDHPLYPTARAKFGLSEKSIRQYCPESMNEFYLNWLAVPKFLYSGSIAQQPSQWPTFKQVGLAQSLEVTHQLVPVHPLTFSEYIWKALDDWPHKMAIHYAPRSYLLVRPTLSVRTMLMVEEPHIHIKLPLPMRTLGSKNIRTIKPSTINDGYVFQQLLQYIASHDEYLSPLYVHCHEQQGGHVDNRADLAWILREYPREVEQASPVCVAALLAENPEGMLVIEQLAEQFYQSNLLALLKEYFSLIFTVHLRLWLIYGITLEANQQNCLVLFRKEYGLKLLLRDNDSGRIYTNRLIEKHPELEGKLTEFEDRRMFVEGDESLLKMFTTINLQLNVTCLINDLSRRELAESKVLYEMLSSTFKATLKQLNEQGVDTNFVENQLVNAPLHYAKYLLSAGSLLSKQESGAASINKYYGLSALNPFKRNCHNA